MSLLSLQELSFYKSCVALWRHSQFPSNAAKAIYMGEEMGVDETAMEVIETYLVKLQMPTKTKRMLISAVNGLVSELNIFIYEMSRQFRSDKNYYRQVKYSVQNVIFTENATLDRAGSLCNIMRLSKFKVQFVPSFLQHHCVEPSTLSAILEEVESNEATLGKSDEDMKKFTKKMDKVALFISYLTPDHYWDKQNQQDLEVNAKSIPPFPYRSVFKYVITKGDIEAMKHRYALLCRNYIGPCMSNEEMFENAKYMFQTNSHNAESIFFFYERLSSVCWKKILTDEFQRIFLALLPSWRHRHLCMQFFYELKDVLESNAALDILREISSMLGDQHYKYDYHDITNIAEQLWDELSCDVRAEAETKFSLIPKLVLPRNNFYALTVFVKDYKVETQEDIVGNIIFNLIITSEEHIKGCLKETQSLGFKKKEIKDFITLDGLKNYLIYKARCPQGNYHKLSQYMCDNEAREKELKENLFQEKHFIVDFFVNCSGEVNDFLNWGLGEPSEIRDFKEKLVAEDLVSAIYERRLLQFASVKEAGKVFKMLKLTKKEKAAERKRVTESPTVIQWVLQSFTESPSSFGFEPHAELDFMSNFLSRPETLDAIYDIILDLPHFEKSYECYVKGPALILKWFRFGEKYLNKYNFQLYGSVPPEEVYSACYNKVKKHSLWAHLEEEYALSIIESRFRCFDLALIDDCADSVKEGRFFDCVYHFSEPFMENFEGYTTIYNHYYRFH